MSTTEKKIAVHGLPAQVDGGLMDQAMEWAKSGRENGDPEGAFAAYLDRVVAAGHLPSTAVVAYDRAFCALLEDESPEEALEHLLAGFIEWDTFGQHTKPPEWLVRPVFIKGGVNTVYSKAGVGKSLFLQHAAAALATGREFLGREAQAPVSVLYIDQELTDSLLMERLEDAGYHVRWDDPERDEMSHLHYTCMPKLEYLNTPEGGAQVTALAKHFNAEVVVIDTTTDSVDGEENSNDPYKKFWRWCVRPLKEMGCTVLLASHSGKDTSLGIRGGSGQAGNADTIWLLHGKGGTTRILRSDKKRHKWVDSAVPLNLETEPCDRYVWTNGAGPDELAVVDALDDIGVSLRANRDECGEALRERGHKFDNKFIGPAQRYRQGRAIPEPDDSED